MKRQLDWFLNPPINGRKEFIILRIMAGAVFFWEGLIKFEFPNQGVGRFTKIGMPWPDITATFVGSMEIIGGILLILGLFTRFISFYFIVQMIVAVLSTKIALYLGTSPLPYPPALPKIGFWAVLHEIRSDYAQIMVCLFLLLAGPGINSLDALLKRTTRTRIV
jgi:putative oxidoreductase